MLYAEEIAAMEMAYGEASEWTRVFIHEDKIPRMFDAVDIDDQVRSLRELLQRATAIQQLAQRHQGAVIELYLVMSTFYGKVAHLYKHCDGIAHTVGKRFLPRLEPSECRLPN